MRTKPGRRIIPGGFFISITMKRKKEQAMFARLCTFLVISGLILGFASVNARAQTMPTTVFCAPVVKLVEVLKNKYGERRSFVGIDVSGRIVEVWSSGTGTFTVFRRVRGVACILTGGKNWTGAASEPGQGL